MGQHNQEAESHESEARRLSVLRSLSVLNTEEDQVFEDALEMAAAICQAPIVFISLLSGRYWLKTNLEIEGEDIACTHSEYGDKALIIENTDLDQRFDRHPLTDGETKLTWYAGAPIYAQHEAVGTLCIFDKAGREFTTNQLKAFEALGRQVSANLDLRLRERKQLQLEQDLRLQLDTAKGMASMIAHARERFENLFNGLPIACCTIDLDGQVMEWNANSEKVFGYSAPEVMYQDIFEILKPEQSKAARKKVMTTIWTGQVTSDFEETVVRKDSSPVCILSSSLPIYDPLGNIVGAIWSSVDITARKQAEELLAENARVIEQQRNALSTANALLEELSNTDPLTGLNNRRACFRFLEGEFEEAKTADSPLSVILLDLDKFKSLNDEFGHPEGDIVLRQAAQILKSNARSGDFVARYGGEEFILVLPKTSLVEAAEVAETMREAMASAIWDKRLVTASFGVATSLSADCTDTLVRSADEALYVAKRDGRNRVATFADPGLAA